MGEYVRGNDCNIAASEFRGSCYAIFPPTAIARLTRCDSQGRSDAVCPFCGVDTVIGDAEGYVITKELLKRLKQRGRL